MQAYVKFKKGNELQTMETSVIYIHWLWNHKASIK